MAHIHNFLKFCAEFVADFCADSTARICGPVPELLYWVCSSFMSYNGIQVQKQLAATSRTLFSPLNFRNIITPI